MNKKTSAFIACCILGIGVQAAGYIYLDQVLFAPLSADDYSVSDAKEQTREALDKAGRLLFSSVSVKGKAYYSHDYHYMADVSEMRSSFIIRTVSVRLSGWI